MTAAGAPPVVPATAPRTVLHLITTLTQGGAERVLSDVVPGPEERGEDGSPERHVVVSLAPGGMFADALRARGVEVRDLGMRPGRDLVRGVRRLRAIRRELRPVLVVGWMYHACLLAWLATRPAGRRTAPRGERRARVAWLLRGSLHTTTGLPRSTRLIIRLLGLLTRLPRRLAPDVVAANSRTGIRHHDRSGYRGHPWVLLTNGVDDAEFHPDTSDRAEVRAELGIPADSFVVIYVARVHRQKDHPSLLDAMDVAARILTRTQAASPLELVLVGSGTETFGATTSGSVRIHGLGARTDVARLLRGADLAVSSSLTEGLPNGLLEALATGLPIVATDVGDSAEVVGRCGRIVPPGDGPALGAAIADLARLEPTRRTELGDAARGRAQHRFGLDRARREYRALWDPAARRAVAADRPVRVAHVIARMNVGGPARIIAGLLDGADPAEIEQTVVTGAVGPGEEDWFELRGGEDPRVHRIPSFGRAIDPVADLRTLRHLTAELRRLAPDVVQTHTAKAGLLGRIAARRAGVPHVVHTFHGHTLHGYFPRPVTAAFTRIERWLAPRTDRLLAVGARVRDELLAAGVGRPEQYEVVPPGVAAPAAQDRDAARAALDLPPDADVVAFIGRLTAVKRPDRLVAAAETVASRRAGVVFLVVGDGELREEVAAAAAAGPADVRLIGWRPDVDAILAASDLVALTSDNEGMPLTLIEAAMAGRACVTTDVGSAGEVVRDGDTGRVVPPDAAAVADAILELLADPTRLAEAGRSARAHAEAEFGLPALVRRVTALHRGLVGAER